MKNTEYETLAENDNYLLLGNDKKFVVLDLKKGEYETLDIVKLNYSEMTDFCEIFDNDIELLQDLLCYTIISKRKKTKYGDYEIVQQDKDFGVLQDTNGEKITLLNYKEKTFKVLNLDYSFVMQDLWEFLKEYTNQEFLNQYINYIITNDYIDTEDIPEALSYKIKVE